MSKRNNMNTAEIWMNVRDPLERFVLKQTGDEEATRDILQNIFLRMQAGLPRLRDQDKLMPWLYRIARSAVGDHFRAEKRVRQLAEAGETPGLPSAPDESEQKDLTEEFSACIPRMLDVLPEKYRQALYLTEIEGLSQKELAERLNISYSGAKSRVQRGREKLREVLLECCYIHTDVYGNIIDYGDRRTCGEEDC